MAGASSTLTSCVSARSLRRFSSAAGCSIILAAAGCGDDEGRVEAETARTGTTDASVPTATEPRTAPPERERTATVPEEEVETGSPEDAPGGAGDEEPARSQAFFTGRGGRISPRLVRVPPFIAIRVELRSADGASYTLRGGGRSLRVGADISAVSTTFAGLRPGRRIVLRGPVGRVAVEASAEPGP